MADRNVQSTPTADSGDEGEDFEMVRSGADCVEALTVPVQRRLAALQALQKHADAARSQMWQDTLAAKVRA